MRLIKFRIQNYKSIIDSGYCTFASDLTVLVGKNESGKTATLEALKYFNKDATRVPDDALPLDDSSREPLVEVVFQLKEEEIEAIRSASGVKLTDGAVDHMKEHGIQVIKDSRGRYSLHQESIDLLFVTQNSQLPVRPIQSAREKLVEILNAPHLPSINYESNADILLNECRNFVRIAKGFLTSIKDEAKQIEAVQAIRILVKETTKLSGSDQTTDRAGEPSSHVTNSVAFFMEHFVKAMPNFIFFSEFSDILPFSVPVTELKNNQAVLDFAKISGLDLDYFIETEDVQRRINFLNRHSSSISGNFLEYWDQDKVELIVKTESDNLLFGVKEQGETDLFKVNQRSKGFQWFLSFYLRINAQKSDNNFIIIDEPGVHLHAKAQREILKILENEITKDTQVIFSTHCPYLIDPQRLDRVRIVTKNKENGTTIRHDIYDQMHSEDMIPVMTAVGGEKTNVMPLPDKQNVIVGGITDFYYWKSLASFLKELEMDRINLIPAADADTMEQLVSLLTGYGLEFQILLNHDNDSWKIGQNLKERFGFCEEKIIFVSEKPGYFTEDLFTPEDFNKHVLNQELDEENVTLNSIYIKNNNINKVLFAREFYDKVNRQKDAVELSDETIKAFRDVYEKILKKPHIFIDDLDDEVIPSETVKTKPVGGKKRKSLFAFLTKK